MAATTVGFIPLQLIPTNALGQYTFDKGFPGNGTYVVVKTPTVAQQLQLTKSLKDMQSGKEINNNESSSKPVILRCKRRVDFTGLGCKLVDSHNPSVSRRNERERKRVKMVNMGFETLRQHVPSGRKNKKMSKVETLRSAVQYIKQLQEMLDATDGDMGDLLSDNVDMDALEDKVTELIQHATNAANNNNMDLNMELDNVSVNDNNGLIQQQQQHQQQQQLQNHHTHQHHQQQHHQQLQQSQHQQLSPESSPSPACSISSQEHFQFQNYQTSQAFTSTYNDYTTASAYSETSTAGSLHSPTSSVVSDSSYDSVGDAQGHDEEDILSGFTNWF